MAIVLWFIGTYEDRKTTVLEILEDSAWVRVHL